MNIFKILANGDGKINEANISAFLGYLLDPYQNHSLGYEFLHRFINIWPFMMKWWKPTPDNRQRELEKGGALTAAEIDRLKRKENKS